MVLAAEILPDDPGTLKAMLIAERARAERLEQIIKELQRHRFGRRAETLPEDQLLLGLEEVEQTAADDAAKDEAASPAERTKRTARRRANRGSLPAHLPRIETLVDVEDKTCPCCQGALHLIGEDRAERLDIVPAQFRVIDRKAERPLAHLAGFVGVLQVGGYRALGERNAVSLAFCWAHVRRRFFELAASGPAPIATEALERIAKLYRIETEIRGRNEEERRLIRQEQSQPILDALEPWLRAKLALISQKTKLAEAIRYTLSRWAGLSRFIDDGRIEIDSNIVERSIRPLALTRKNALFAGSDGGAEHWAVIASLIETCKLNSIDPHAYLVDIITKIVNGHPNSRIDDLLPWAYHSNTTARLEAVA